MPLQDQLAEALDLQQHYAPRDSPATTRRNWLVQDDIPASLREALPGSTFAIDSAFLHVYGSGSTGLNAKVPWVLISDKRFTKSAQDGWYLVLLFAEDGSGLNLSLNKNSTRPGEYVSGKWTANPLPDHEIKRDRDWAVGLLRDSIRAHPELTERIDLKTSSATGRAYEKSHVVGRYYPRSALPDEFELVSDLSVIGEFLNTIYNSLDSGSESSETVVHSPTTDDLENSETTEYSPTTDGPGRQSNTPLKLATEQHAVDRATKYLEGEGYEVEDVGAFKSFDLRATKGGEILCVEVKGSVGTPSSVNLTYNEVQVARNAPRTLLIVVDRIRWKQDATTGGIETFDGNLRKWWGWKADEDLLTPTEYRYELPPEEVDKPTDG
jgi:hypothetical protein